ncbi:phage tail tape measure protein [Limosilactobacillus vaginalis]|uniref:phage tail tape measure protein n=1 Tax=Limosilactobacillus vaginalis TaxID=1633 RepID=UPI00242B88C3|nr:phage tail tape measure protein [Limosilactobacillus vaginalis]
MTESYSVRAILSAVDSSFSSTLARAGQATQSFGSAVNQKMQVVGKAMTVAGAATTAMGVKAVKGFGDFQASLNQAAVIAGGTSKNIGELADVANHMGAVLPISAQDAADAMVEMARNGASLDDIKKQFPAIAEAATAAGANLQTTAGVVQQSMNIWGDSLKSPQQAAAILVQTANASNASIEDMQQALATIGSTAKMAGMDMQTTSEAIGLLTNRGFSAAQASDDLNHAITQMLAPSSIAKKKMDELGLTFVDSAGKMKPFPQILQEIADKTNGMGDAQKTAALKAMFGASGMKAIAPLLDAINNKTGDAKNSWSAYAAEQDKAAHSTAAATKFLEQQANDMQQNIGSKIEQVGGNWEALRNKAMAAKGGVNGAMLDMINQSIEWATTSNNSMAQFIRGFVGLSPVIGPAITAVGAFTTNVGKIVGLVGGAVGAIGNLVRVFIVLKQAANVTEAVSALSKLAQTSKLAKTVMVGLQAGQAIFTGLKAAAMALGGGLQALWGIMLTNPITLVIAAIAAVVAALVLFFTKTKTGQQMWSNFVNFLKNAWNGLVSVAQTVWNAITQAFQKPIEVIKTLWSGIKDFFSQLWQGIVSTAQGVWSSFTTGMAPIIDSIKTLWSALTDFFSVLWQGIVTTAQTIWNTLVQIFTPIVEAIKAVWQPISEFFSQLWQGIVTTAQTVWQGLITVVQTVWTNIQTVVQTAIQVLSTVIQTGMQVIQTVWSTIWNVLSTVVQTVWSIITTIVSTAINALAGIIRAVTAAIQGDWSGAWNAIKDVVSTVWNGIKTVVTTAINGVRSVITSVMNGIKSVMTSIWNAIKSVTSSVMSGIRSVVSSGMSSVRSVVSNMMNAVRSAFSAGWNAARSVTSSGINAAVNVVRSAASSMASAGRNFVMGFVNGIRGAIGAAASAAASMARAAMSSAKAALGIHSPSRVMRDQVGYYVAAGMAVGMRNNADMVQKAANRLAQSAVPSIDLGASINGVMNQGRLSNTINGTINHELTVNQQPAYINVALGGSEYSTFVEDISREQGNQASLQRNYRF